MLCFRTVHWKLLQFTSIIGHMLGKKRGMNLSITPTPKRLLQVPGFEKRTNDIIYCKPTTKSTASDAVVVFFGGDVQDFIENMQKNSESQQFARWNLDNMALLLHSFFPDNHIVVVKPSRMDLDLYSCYENFVPSVKYGVPKHMPMNHAVEHLLQLLHGLTLRLRVSADQDAKQTADLSTAHLALIGFSKGCVVLNQFLYEFHYMKTLTPDDSKTSRYLSRIKEMYWLDAGHGAKNVWITSRSLLQTLAGLGIKVHIHVTPYQVDDENRPWIRKEEQQFTKLLRELNANVDRTLHFGQIESDLSLHFELLAVFRKPKVPPSPSE